MRGITLLFALLFLSCCTSFPRTTAQQIDLLATSNRYLALKGSLHQAVTQGGLDREWNATRQWSNRESTLYVCGGTNLISKTFNVSERKEITRKANLMIEGLDLLGVDAIGLSTEETKLGYEAILKMAQNSKDRIVSTNLKLNASGGYLARPFLALQKNGFEIAVFALSDGKSADPKILLEDSVPAFRKAWSALKNRPQLVVLLSSLSDANLKRVLEAFPQINVVVGGESGEPNVAELMGPTTLYLNPLELGRQFTHLSLRMSGTSDTRFYNLPRAEKLKASLVAWKDQLENVQVDLVEAGKKETIALKKSEKRLVSDLAMAEKMALEYRAGDTLYEATTVTLDEAHSSPRNPITVLLGESESAVREVASKP